MRPTPQIKTTRPVRDRPAACACAALALALPVLLSTAPAAASEAGNPFAPASPAAPSAVKQASGAGKATGTSPTSAAGAGKAAARAPGVGKVSTATTPAKGAIIPSQVAPAKTTTASTSTSTQESSSGTSTSEILGLVAAGLLLGGIAFMILRDARSVAPVTEGLVTGGTRNPEGRLRKRRAQAKAARLQRKRHRKR